MKPAVDVAIIGAGFAGLGAAIQLLRNGRTNFVVFERAAEVGGTWRDNTYPGCACDVPSHLYSFSFAPNPRWSRTYSPQPEIQQYIQNTVEQFGLRPYIRFNTEIVRTEFREEYGYWELTDRVGQTTTARVVIGAIGPLNRPSIPKLPGIDSFMGRAFHSSAWDHTVELTGKRVAVIGTGASAIQIVPELAKIVGQLSVYQRTAPYVVPRLDQPIGGGMQRLFGQIPALQQLNRAWIYWFNELKGLGFIGNKTIAKLAADEARKHRETSISNPDLLQKVTPDYQLGCKRVLVSDDYYPALTRPNVSLITDPIQAVTPTGIVTADGTKLPTDVIVYGTGFVAADIISDLTIIGLSGQNLFETWLRSGAEAYKGITVSGFPGLLFLVGPNTGLGHNSIIHMIESQVNYALDYLRLLDRTGASAYLDVKPAVQAAYNERLQQNLRSTVWASGCQSWYMNVVGRNTTIWPKLTVAYRRETARVDPADYEIVTVPALAH